ncbi:MAG: type II secretion system protein GspG [Phycisphaeraceae bacterium]|nr:type II secretion system protein GspG [Phycisphaeraceae bacterium]
MPNQRRRRGFTLIEVLLVLVIIALLAGIAIFAIGGTSEQASIDATRAKLRQLESALEQFNLQVRRYPTTDEGLRALIDGPQDTDGDVPRVFPLVQPDALEDAWGTPINYELVEADGDGARARFYVWSSGPNRQNDNREGDDILPRRVTADTPLTALPAARPPPAPGNVRLGSQRPGSVPPVARTLRRCPVPGSNRSEPGLGKTRPDVRRPVTGLIVPPYDALSVSLHAPGG